MVWNQLFSVFIPQTWMKRHIVVQNSWMKSIKGLHDPIQSNVEIVKKDLEECIEPHYCDSDPV